MNPRERFANVLEELCTVYDIELRAGRAELYWANLKQYSASVVEEAARDLRTTCKRFPTLAEWIERCKAIAAQRARATAPVRESAEPAAPATWTTTAHIAVLKAAIRGVRVSDPAMRERALELALGELIELREEHNSPASVPRARLTAEQERIARVLVRELAAEASTAAPTT